MKFLAVVASPNRRMDTTEHADGELQGLMHAEFPLFSSHEIP